MTDSDDDFDAALWLAGTKITEAGLKKVANNDIIDWESLVNLGESDIAAIKLSVGDKGKLVAAIVGRKLSKVKVPSPGPKQPVEQPEQPGTSNGTSNGVQEQVGDAGINSESQKTSFDIAEVAAFLAGKPVPENLRASIASVGGNANQSSITVPGYQSAVQSAVTVPGYQDSSSDQQYQQWLNQRSQQSQRGSLAGTSLQQSSYPANNAQLPWLNQQVGYNRYPGPAVPSTIPIYQPQQHHWIPSRLANTQSLGRDPHLQRLADGYQQQSMRDLLSLNEYNPALGYQGEQPLYLPVNFISHLRGHRNEDEELIKTDGGASLYLGFGNKKIQPDKLTQGLFFGANARILARMLPTVTPEIACYLDYLRKIGDLLINYSSTSVYLLDHIHRFEVVEQFGKAWNDIDATLSLNILKKKDSSSLASTCSQKSGTASSTGSNSSRSVPRKSQVICWQYNQPDGCSYTPDCRFQHVCNIEGCGMDHPATKHPFRGYIKPKTVEKVKSP